VLTGQMFGCIPHTTISLAATHEGLHEIPAYVLFFVVAQQTCPGQSSGSLQVSST
jgi:hypothetical protein